MPFLKTNVCLGCLLRATSEEYVSDKVEMRQGTRWPFKPAKLRLVPHRLTTDSLKDYIPISIKVCEHARETLEASREFILTAKPPGEQLRERSVNAGGHPAFARRIDMLRHKLLTSQNGLCSYCMLPADECNTVLDTVMPTGFAHTGLNKAVKCLYYELNATFGNVRAVHRDCNMLKGFDETRGYRILQGIYNREYSVILNDETKSFRIKPEQLMPMALCSVEVAYEVEIHGGRFEKMRGYAERLACLLAERSLRVTDECHCFSRGMPYRRAYYYNNQLMFFCAKCDSGNVRPDFIVKCAGMQQNRRLTRLKNPLKRHRNALPQHRT